MKGRRETEKKEMGGKQQVCEHLSLVTCPNWEAGALTLPFQN